MITKRRCLSVLNVIDGCALRALVRMFVQLLMACQLLFACPNSSVLASPTFQRCLQCFPHCPANNTANAPCIHVCFILANPRNQAYNSPALTARRGGIPGLRARARAFDDDLWLGMGGGGMQQGGPWPSTCVCVCACVCVCVCVW